LGLELGLLQLLRLNTLWWPVAVAAVIAVVAALAVSAPEQVFCLLLALHIL
jgi:hypothetical protein